MVKRLAALAILVVAGLALLAAWFRIPVRLERRGEWWQVNGSTMTTPDGERGVAYELLPPDPALDRLWAAAGYDRGQFVQVIPLGDDPRFTS